MSQGRCVSCHHWFDDIADRQCPEVPGECQHPDIKELVSHYLPMPENTELKINPEPFAPCGEFGCVLWAPMTRSTGAPL